MDTRTGQLYFAKDSLDADQKSHLVEVRRDLTLKERLDMQVRKYSPCVCGSGKKFKFCCWKP